MINGKPWTGSLRDLADDSDRTSFTTTAAGMAKVVASLPLPPDGSNLFVQIGNELNLVWGCSCSEAEIPCMSMDTAAAESAYYLRYEQV